MNYLAVLSSISLPLGSDSYHCVCNTKVLISFCLVVFLEWVALAQHPEGTQCAASLLSFTVVSPTRSLSIRKEIVTHSDTLKRKKTF